MSLKLQMTANEGFETRMIFLKVSLHLTYFKKKKILVVNETPQSLIIARS